MISLLSKGLSRVSSSITVQRHQFFSAQPFLLTSSHIHTSVQLLNVSDSLRPHGYPVHHQLPELTQTHVHRVGDAIQPSHPLLSPSPPAFIISQLRVFSSESALHTRWTKDWNFSFSTSPSNEYAGLISFRIDWFYLLAVQGTLKSPCGCHVGSI